MEIYVNEIKENKIKLNEECVENISIIFFNTGVHGSAVGSKEEKNKFKNYFDENSGLNRLLDIFKHLISQTLSPIRLLDIFKHLISQTLSPIQKRITDRISITICQLLKNEKPPLSYGCVLEYVNNLKSSPSPTSGYDFPSAAKNSWDGMLNADECLSSYKN
jgi:hypothetical protein